MSQNCILRYCGFINDTVSVGYVTDYYQTIRMLDSLKCELSGAQGSIKGLLLLLQALTLTNVNDNLDRLYHYLKTTLSLSICQSAEMLFRGKINKIWLFNFEIKVCLMFRNVLNHTLQVRLQNAHIQIYHNRHLWNGMAIVSPVNSGFISLKIDIG